MGDIRKLGDDSIRRIVAEQAISDLSSVVKELVDNAIDAESNTIKVRLFGQGLEVIEVSDDGSGVPASSRPHLATRYSTSKITSFEDIYSGTGLTMGFRGEALFSMACLSQKLVVATRTEDEEMAQMLEYKRDGSLDPESVKSMHRKVGTTVAVVQPFATLPARRADLTRRIRTERANLFRLMESYAIFNVGTQFNLIDMTTSGREEVALATSASSTRLEETVSSVLGHKFWGTLAPIEIDLTGLLNTDQNSSCKWEMRGLVSKNPQAVPPGRHVNYFCINGRVVQLPNVTRLLRKIWSGFGGKKKPSCLLCFTLPNNSFDINISPDKQQVLLSNEQEMSSLIDDRITQYWSSQTNGVFQKQKLEVPDARKRSVSVAGNLAEDEDEGGEWDGQRHKRRFAFVHDLSKAKLQHDLEDRQKFCDDQSERDTNASDVDGTAAKPDSMSISNEELVEVRPNGIGRPSRKLQPEGLSLDVNDKERRSWQEVQQKFSQDDSETDIQSQHQRGSAPVTPADTSDGRSLSSSPETEAKQLKQVPLSQFAFAPTGASPSRKRQQTRSTGVAPKEAINTFVSSASATSQLVHEDRDTETNKELLVSKPEEQVSRTSARTSPGLLRTIPSNECDDGPQCSPRSVECGPVVLNPESKPSVTWGPFQGTEAIVEISRQARIRMHEKKRSLDDSMQREKPGVTDTTPGELRTPDESDASHVSLSKTEFRESMQVIGQFNLGFIVARCSNDHLWILDQHACDEKSTFERLCRDTMIHEQRLLSPMALDLSPSEEACVLDNMDIFRVNGFRFDFRPDAPVRQRLSLTALPHSGAQDGRRAVQFGKDDVSALCAILSEGSAYDAGSGGTGTDGSGKYGNNAVRRHASTVSTQPVKADRIIARLPKAIAMFASRACRGSIMIGTALSQKEMEKIVKKLADVEHPWNCPHGRPTMRHVGNVRSFLRNDERRNADAIAGPTGKILPMTQQVSCEDEQRRI